MTFLPDEAAAARILVQLALAEDLGRFGDRTSRALIPAEQQAAARFVVRTAGVVAGLPVAAMVCEKLHITSLMEDGAAVSGGTAIATVSGSLREILAAERTALNFLQRLSGVATLTRRFVDAVHGTGAKILDTRKTTPGWRLLEKYAVRMGGGTNHRLGLFDGILIKDNHLAGLNGDVRRAVMLAREAPGNETYAIEVEVDSLEQLDEALAARADIVLLDNMDVVMMREAVRRRDAVSPDTKLEASGGVNLQTVRAIAETGVDRISVGAITHSATALDIALDYGI
ncbi:MAG: carboxylating nicotinate-nucleotide diphosphorylase [Gemmataceae bacterium]